MKLGIIEFHTKNLKILYIFSINIQKNKLEVIQIANFLNQPCKVSKDDPK